MKVQIIIGSTRPGRLTPRLAKWVANEANKLEDVEAEIVDLIDYDLPFLDEPISPRYNPDRHPNEQVQKWINKIAEGDAYIFVTPEYNHSISGALKNAIDYLTFEMVHKPATIVAHGSYGGARAIVALKVILSESRAAVLPFSVALIGRTGENLSENGILAAELGSQQYGPATALATALEDLKWYGDALLAARSRA